MKFSSGMVWVNVGDGCFCFLRILLQFNNIVGTQRKICQFYSLPVSITSFILSSECLRCKFMKSIKKRGTSTCHCWLWHSTVFFIKTVDVSSSTKESLIICSLRMAKWNIFAVSPIKIVGSNLFDVYFSLKITTVC